MLTDQQKNRLAVLNLAIHNGLSDLRNCRLCGNRERATPTPVYLNGKVLGTLPQCQPSCQPKLKTVEEIKARCEEINSKPQ